MAATEREEVPWVVALVGSAGGPDAITRLLRALPAEFPAGVLVLLHQSPKIQSHLTQVLGRECRLPVELAADGAVIRPGRVLVAPSGRHLLLADSHHVALIVSGETPPSRPSADLLLTTLAITCRARAITVVLSGYGRDGATGATAVKAFGGTVIASDEATSTVFSMPSATIDRDHVVDHVLPLEAIAETLVALVDAPT